MYVRTYVCESEAIEQQFPYVRTYYKYVCIVYMIVLWHMYM